MAFIFCLSSLPEIPGPKAVTEHSHLGHFVMYGVLGILLRRAMPARHPAVSIVSGFFYGLSDEFHQHFVPPRTAGVDDLVMDLLGAACGVVLLSRIRRQD
jgi:VanZ family protein